VVNCATPQTCRPTLADNALYLSYRILQDRRRMEAAAGWQSGWTSCREPPCQARGNNTQPHLGVLPLAQLIDEEVGGDAEVGDGARLQLFEVLLDQVRRAVVARKPDARAPPNIGKSKAWDRPLLGPGWVRGRASVCIGSALARHHRQRDPMHGCQIRTNRPILHAKQNTLNPLAAVMKCAHLPVRQL
jgi:hypothetical protein